MLSDTKTASFDQQVISDNSEIFNRIKTEFENAQKEIIIASAWFTDSELFDVLLQKVGSVNVDIIIGDNQENTRLDFEQLAQRGGKYLKIRNVGYGMMHQKFCVVDESLAIHGSYNYTHNARLNNHESVIATTHKPTIQSLLDNFYSMKVKAAEKSGETDEISKAKIMNTGPTELEKDMQDNSRKPSYQVEFEKVLNTLIDAEINDFSRKELYNMGLQRSEACNGDHSIMPNALDTVYFNFINDLNITEEKKAHLLAKISEQRISQLQTLEIEYTRDLNTHKVEFSTKRSNLTNYIAVGKSNVQIIDKKIEGIKNNDITSFQKQIIQIKEKINEARREFIVPKLRLFDFIPLLAFNLGFLVYLTLFYSSAAYILLFSKLDTLKAIKNGAEVPPHQVFEPNAISNALEHGGAAILFICLFVFIPIGFALSDRYVANKYMKFFLSYILGVFLVDGLLAYTVAKSIHELRVLTGEIGTPWVASDAFGDVNFYLVFIMGAAPLLVFKFAFSKFMSLFEARSADINAQKNEMLIRQYEVQIDDLNKEIEKLNKDIENFEVEKINLKKQIDAHQHELDNLPITEAAALEKIEAEYALKKQYFNHICDLYKNKIENNNPNVSIDALRDRINIFLEGWNDFLHKFFSVAIATEKSGNATKVATEWLTAKLLNDKIDARVKA